MQICIWFRYAAYSMSAALKKSSYPDTIDATAPSSSSASIRSCSSPWTLSFARSLRNGPKRKFASDFSVTETICCNLSSFSLIAFCLLSSSDRSRRAFAMLLPRAVSSR